MKTKVQALVTIFALAVWLSTDPGVSSHAGAFYATPQTTTKTLAERLGYPRDAKLLIVHADDLAVAHSVDAASIKAFESGLVTSGSIMIPCPWLPEIAAYARANPNADLGLHLTLTSEWKLFRWASVLPKDKVSSLFDATGYFYPTESEAAAHIDVKEAEAEIRAQIARAKSMGIQPTHLDSHMGTLYQTKELFEVLLRAGRENKLPMRIARQQVTSIPFLSSLMGPDDVVIDNVVTIGPEVSAAEWNKYYLDAIENLPPGVTELIVHLAYDDPEMKAITVDHPNWGSEWRQRDFNFVTSNEFRDALKTHNVKLTTWRELGKLLK